MKHILLLLLIPIFLACKTEVIDPPNKYIKDGIIVWQKPLWKVPHDTAYYVMSFFEPFQQFDDKVIGSTYRNAMGGIRCMEIETGRVVWEKLLGHPAPPHTLSLNIRNPYLNITERFLIVSFGPWGDRKHARLNLDTGATEWEIPLETFATMEGMGDHYYCTVATSDEVAPIYRVDVNTGIAEHFYTSTLEAHPSFNAQRRAVARPFMYNNKEYLILDEVRFVDPSTSLVEHFFSLMDAETKELLIKQQPIDSPVSKVELVNGELYMFTGNGYKILNLETLTITREVKLINRGDYVYHNFYNDKLIIGLCGRAIHPELGIDNAHYVVDLKTHSKLFQFEGSVYPTTTLENYIYLGSSSKFRAYSIKTGKCALNFSFPHDGMPGVATYKNAGGKKFVIAEDIGFTYCFEAI